MYQHVLICSVGPVTLCVYRTLYDCVMWARGHIYITWGVLFLVGKLQCSISFNTSRRNRCRTESPAETNGAEIRSSLMRENLRRYGSLQRRTHFPPVIEVQKLWKLPIIHLQLCLQHPQLIRIYRIDFIWNVGILSQLCYLLLFVFPAPLKCVKSC